MAAETGLLALRAADPAAELAPLAEAERVRLRDAAMAAARSARRSRPRLARGTVALAVVLLAGLGVGVARSAGAFENLPPKALFETNPQGSMDQGIPVPREYWDQTVIPDSVQQVASVDISDVGQVAYWHGVTEQGGWCAALQLPDGDWLSTPGSKLDGGGVVPGCFPRRDEHGFDWLNQFVDARSVGGWQWQIRFGEVRAPGAVKVTDLVSGASTDVVDGNLFELLIPEPNPPASTPNDFPPTDLVAYDQAGNVVANLCPQCAGG